MPAWEDGTTTMMERQIRLRGRHAHNLDTSTCVQRRVPECRRGGVHRREVEKLGAHPSVSCGQRAAGTSLSASCRYTGQLSTPTTLVEEEQERLLVPHRGSEHRITVLRQHGNSVDEKWHEVWVVDLLSAHYSRM